MIRSRSLLLLQWLLLAAPAMAAEPPARYGDPTAAAPRSSLARRAEEAARRASQTPVVVDPRLEVALDLLVPQLPDSGPPQVQLSERALRLAGIVEPAPYLLTMTVPAGADEDALQKVSEMVPAMISRGHYGRVAAATSPIGPPGAGAGASDGMRLVLALQESYITLAPIARSVPLGTEVALDGTIAAPYRSPLAFVTSPDGNVLRPPVVMGAGLDGGGRATADQKAPANAGARAPVEDRFHAAFRCEKPGEWQVEVVGEDQYGEAVLANFPVFCGVAAPRVLEPSNTIVPRVGDPSGRGLPSDPGQLRAVAEARALELIQADRRHVALPPLTLDPRLCAVARQHSEDMRDHNFFGHLSPTTGSAMNRLERAKFFVLRVRENLGRAYSPEELERGLMGSPSHRLNLQSPDVERVGVGIAVGSPTGTAGLRDLYLTQLFAHLPEPFNAARADGDLRARLDRLREGEKLAKFGVDPALDKVARDVAQGLAEGSLSPDHPSKSDPVSQALPSLADHYKWVRKVSALALDVAQFGSSPALVDREATTAGVAAVQVSAANAARAGVPAGNIYFVVLLAARR